MAILAIDLGTQSVRAAIVDIKGYIRFISQITQDVHTPHPGWAQQKPEVWWDLMKKVISDVIKKSGENNSLSYFHPGIFNPGKLAEIP